MSTVSRLRENTVHQLAEASGAPRPVRQPMRARPRDAAPVIELRPCTGDAEGGAPPEEGRARIDAAPRRLDHDADPDADAESETSRRVARIARSVAQGALEVLAGTRPLQQLARWLDPENYERLQLRTNLVRCITQPVHRVGAARTSTPRHVLIRSVRICEVTSGIYEASVVAFDQKRVRAIALRIEQWRGSWRITALEIG
ncbi:Rv3235 family protein [uncultured Arthrobacter sp.]|uniref:Rv3235 family protein n=1 Tax=uncultured Arthrobacter sp. TaxID=114050 RepID=UPI0026393C0A|nr:Rv3235 family protein [uncultured Arthrobacter sp.]